MVIRWNGDEAEMPMDNHGRAKAFESLMNYSRVEHVPFDKLVRTLAEEDGRSARDRAALCYSFRLVDIIRFLFALRHGLGHTDEYSNGETVDTLWRPDEVRTALEHEFRQTMRGL